MKHVSAGDPIRCSQCSIGTASGLGQGQFCPFIDRDRNAGEMLFVEGEPAEYVWFVKRGTIALMRESGDASEGRVRALRVAGTFVGLEAIVSGMYWDTARAVSDVTVCGATRDAMDHWLGPHGTPSRTALEITLRSMSADASRPGANAASSLARVASWLRDEVPGGATAALPRKLIAELLGMRAETLSRTLAQLIERGAIDATRTELTVLDRALLDQLARE
jgi:CRP/FNR family transcriptional regulator